MNQTFLLSQIRLYNLSKKRKYKDVALMAIGIHAGLLNKAQMAFRQINNEERKRVIYFARQYLASSRIKAKVKDYFAPQCQEEGQSVS